MREQLLEVIETFPLDGSDEDVLEANELRTQVMLRLVEGLMKIGNIGIWYPEVRDALQYLSTEAQWWISEGRGLRDLEPTVLVQTVVF